MIALGTYHTNSRIERCPFLGYMVDFVTVLACEAKAVTS